MKKFFALAVVVGLMNSCAPKFNASSGLFWGNWILMELDGQPVQVSGTDRDANILFNYNDMVVSGFAGCNRFNSGMTADHKNIAFGNMAVTSMACENQAFEDKYLAVLKDVRKYEVDRNE